LQPFMFFNVLFNICNIFSVPFSFQSEFKTTELWPHWRKVKRCLKYLLGRLDTNYTKNQCIKVHIFHSINGSNSFAVLIIPKIVWLVCWDESSNTIRHVPKHSLPFIFTIILTLSFTTSFSALTPLLLSLPHNIPFYLPLSPPITHLPPLLRTSCAPSRNRSRWRASPMRTARGVIKQHREGRDSGMCGVSAQGVINTNSQLFINSLQPI
jgi:hypothetical protein